MKNLDEVKGIDIRNLTNAINRLALAQEKQNGIADKHITIAEKKIQIDKKNMITENLKNKF